MKTLFNRLEERAGKGLRVLGYIGGFAIMVMMLINVIDISMPRLNGIDLVRMIKKDSRLQAIPVVIVSYKDREEDRLQGLEAGANYYLTKSSFHDETLLKVVQELIGGNST